MAITLTGELEELVNKKVRSGKYRSADEVIVAGLRLLEAQEKGMAALRREIMRGIIDDPIFQFGEHPVEDKVTDASENHDRYIYNQ
jgi:putative addiction module CopG family antidote